MALVGRARNVVFLGEHPLSRVTERQTENYIIFHNYKKKFFATHMSVLLLNFVDFYYMLCKIIKFVITVMIDGDDFFQ